MTVRRIALSVGAVLSLLILLLAVAGGGSDAPTSTLLGQRVPLVTGETLEGDDYDIDRSRGRWVVVNFFATWCPPCIAEHPDLVALEQIGAENGQIDVVANVFNDSPENVAEFFAENGGSWPVLSDPAVAVEFQIRRVPESFLVDPFGVVRVHYTGGVTTDQILADIETLS